MDYTLKTGTDSEGNAVTTTLNVQMNFVWEYCNAPPDLNHPNKWSEEMYNAINP